MTPEEPLLRLVGITKSFGDHEVIQPTDLVIDNGEFFTLLGPSGCGKTTMLRIVSGFEQATSGRVELRGKPLDRVPPERRPFNMVFQSYALFPHMSVAENVGYGLRIAGRPGKEIRERVGDALALVHLGDSGDRPVTQLSGGQQQRVALARALINEPEVLLLDEPLGALDLKLRKHLQNELRQIQRRLGTTFVYVTHDQEEALTLSHRIALVDRGRIVQVGSPREVYERPATRFVADFVGETNLIECEVVEAEASSAVVRFGEGAVARLAYYGSSSLSTGERALAALRPEHLEFTTAEEGVFTGELRETVFLGTHCRHEVELAKGGVLRVAGAPAGLGDAASVSVGVRQGTGAVVRHDEPRTADAAQAVDPSANGVTSAPPDRQIAAGGAL